MEVPRLLWTPDEKLKNTSNLKKYLDWLDRTKGLSLGEYNSLWKWSVDQPDDFWESLWQYFAILHDGTYKSVFTG
jgi:acetoacetyl-CoA synthetase